MILTLLGARWTRPRYGALCGVVLLSAVGCNRTADTPGNLAQAIDAYYKVHPACVWKEPKQFPVAAAPTNATESFAFDALVNQGLLTHQGGYDVSKKGKSSWRAEPGQPELGNFCYGRREVDNINNSTPTSADPGSTTEVVYKYRISGVPKWAKATEIQSAFPDLRANLAEAQLGRATLTDSAKGWTVTSAPDGHIPNSASKIVE